MSAVNIINSKEEYTQLFKTGNYSFMQSWEWGESKKDQWKLLRIAINKVPVTIYLKKIPLVNKQFGYIPRAFDDLSLSNTTLEELLKFSKDMSISHIIVEPNSSDIDKIELFNRLKFKNTGRTIQPNYTNIVDLTQSEEEILNGFEKNCRRLVRKAGEMSMKVEIFENGEVPLQRFYSILSDIEKRTKYVKHGFDYFEKIWKEMSSSNFVRIYIVSLEGKDLGSLFVVYDKLRGNQLYGGVTQEGRSIRAGYFLNYEVFKDAKKLVVKEYDQWGVAKYDENGEYDKNDELFNISNYKSSLGGKNVSFLPQFTFVIDEFGYHLYNIGLLFNKYKIKLIKLLRRN